MAAEFEEDADFCDSSDDDLMSTDEEDYIDKILSGDVDYDEDDDDDDYREYFPGIPELNNYSQTESVDSSLHSSQDPLAQSDMNWKDKNIPDDSAPTEQPFRPLREPGLQLGRFTRFMKEKMKEPIEFFKLFFTIEVIQFICKATNEYAEEMHARRQRTSYFTGPGNTWIPVTEDEMYRFIGILIYMSIHKLPTLSRYWSTGKIYKTIVPTFFSQRRFKAILSFLQTSTPENIDKAQKLTRIQKLIDTIRETAKELYQPLKNITVDERMLPSKHRYSGIRQFVKDKPVRFGFKVWVLACSVTGYTYNFNVYLGKKNTSVISKKGLAYDVVHSLITDLLDQGYHLYIDNFFTSRHLILFLINHNTSVIGTIKRNSSAMPDCFKDVNIWGKIASRGDFRWVREDGYLVIQWQDSSTVSLVSTIHNANDTTTCNRKLKKRTTWGEKVYVQPKLASDYNKYMGGGVDKSDQLLSNYSVYVKCMIHWWKVLFYHCLDIAIVNSYILYLEYAKKFDTPLPSKFGQLEFRELLVESLLSFDTSKRQSKECLPIVHESRSRCKLCYAEAIMSENNPQNFRSQFYCPSCDVHLCISADRNCFARWHSEGGRKFRGWCQAHEKRTRFC